MIKSYVFIKILVIGILQVASGIKSKNPKLELSPTPLDVEDKRISYIVGPNKIEVKVLDPNYELIDYKCDNAVFKETNLKRLIQTKTPCTNLHPCKKYVVITNLKYRLNSTTIALTETVQTNYTAPSIQINTIIPYADSIHISWNASNQECISNYTFTARSDDSLASVTCGSGSNDVELKNLNPCQNYSIQVISYDVQDNKFFNKNFSAETDTTDPGPVKSIKYEYVQNNSSVKFKWEPPKYKYCVHFYDLQWALYRNVNDTKKLIWNHYNYTDIENNEFTIKNTTGCDKYIFKIVGNGDELHNSFNITFDSPEQVPGPVQQLQIQSKYSTNVTIEWQPPELHSKCIKKYQMEFYGPYQFHNSSNTSLTNITYNNLKPCGTHNFTIKPITINGLEGKQNNISLTTENDKPSQVLNATAQSYPKEILIMWNTPLFSELCITKYRISGYYVANGIITNKAFDNSTNATDTSITIQFLKSCTLYEIEIIATTGKYDGQPVSIKSKTKPSTATSPDTVEVKSQTHNSLVLRAEYTDSTNNCQVLSVRFSCKSLSDDSKIKYAETIIDVNESIALYTGIVKPLSPNTQYNCKVVIFNIAGLSPPDTGAICETKKYYPDIPEAIQIDQITENSFHIRWKPPTYPNGNIIMYSAHIQTLRSLYKVPSNCADIEWARKTVEISKTELIYRNALSYVEYGIQIAVLNDYGMSEFSRMIRVKTKATQPTDVNEFFALKIAGPSLNENKYEAYVLLNWLLPCRTNGEISLFTLNFVGRINNYTPNIEFTRIYYVKDDPLISDIELFIWNETQLSPDYQYMVTIKVQLKQGYESMPSSTSFISPAGIPHKLNISGRGVVDAFASNNPTSRALAKISNDIFTTNVGFITYAALLISEKGCQEDPNLKYNVLESDTQWPNITNWSEAQLNKACIKQYQTTPLRWRPLRNNYDPEIYNNSYVPFTIGTDTNCNDRPNEFCNGPLKPGTKYNVVLRLFTKSGYNDIAYLSFHTDSEVQLVLVILLAVSCLVFAFILGIIYLWITKRMKWHRESVNGMENSNGDVNAKNFLLHYSELSKRDKLHREFKELSSITNDLDLSYNASKLNETKNRYSNIYPYDRNRVILDSDSEGSDYINASFINGYKKKKEYIATQGPKPDCFIDFWRMVLQYNVRIIVMLTEMREGETIKCHQYFPIQTSDTMKFGHNITVTCKKDIKHNVYERREFIVKHSGYGLQRNVIHYFFKKWPDHDCPTDSNDLIYFIRKIKSEKIPNRSPIVAHCSAGCGRTGTFIGLDIIMNRLKSENRINIFETVKELRYQRVKMVQTIHQYQFLYKCAFQLVKKNFSPTNKTNVGSIKHSNSNSNLNPNNTSGSSTLGEQNTQQFNRSNSNNGINERNLSKSSYTQQSFSPNEMETTM